ncbi:coenzyme PQQ synthesis protein D [Novosphingobium nitrogenifigens DSM 19370]|uniref:Coenzyme PQQ synthesis protein D n=1 Tax=Novosphingobium nitrogenifigens DSM 19370 TaxID=983920 RepID=F1ZBA0_9SPHN|nr:pyrroloquinoline quinone biosynthesis peptide chaperone PqqD [Novosphingobium nitrogenifigens]EGD58202.1 coenzyme PQQ synthesis protein D [Novosphingobium nitrogenifigens DSM 19370]
MTGQVLPTDTVPRFRRGVKLREDKARGGWVLLAPEKAFVLDEIGVEVLKLVDGVRSVSAIGSELAERFQAPVDEVTGDIAAMLADLVARGAIEG